jgi:hypothetical protein
MNLTRVGLNCEIINVTKQRPLAKGQMLHCSDSYSELHYLTIQCNHTYEYENHLTCI